ncbi:MAG: hypothetical protein IPQ09_17650 [Myxococcales bacterium]|nr:hypothetical protein [Myxococcales bacterium]HQY63165.1 hypothetical protein [Polyangiaceae bacterium]
MVHAKLPGTARLIVSSAAATASLVLLGVGCLADPQPSEVQCTSGGATYRVGDTFKAFDCNTCTCTSSGRVQCSVEPCVCELGGKTIARGDSVPSLDGCNTCTCLAGGLACTERYCAPDGGADGASDARVDAGGACSYDGKVYPDGATFPATDGCNTCTCTAATVGCTKRACADAGDAGDAGYTCPPDGTINCMPPLTPPLARLCSGPEHDFIVAKCPGVRFVY